jgi:hypothetical protein
MNGPSLPVATTLSALRLALTGTAPGFVPTMGALHQGHGALISRSVAENPATVVSIFVNPTQFDDPVDFARYPRLLDRDATLAATHGATLLFVPAVAEVYPPGFATSVEVDGLADRWEAAFRPGHFRLLPPWLPGSSVWFGPHAPILARRISSNSRSSAASTQTWRSRARSSVVQRCGMWTGSLARHGTGDFRRKRAGAPLPFPAPCNEWPRRPRETTMPRR